MWKKISDCVHSVSSSRMAFLAMGIFLFFTVFVLPGQAAKAGEIARDAGSPDLSIYYTSQDLYRMADAYGHIGRQIYVKTRFTFDLIWPLIYMLFLCTGISWLYSRGFDQGTFWQQANIMPIWAMFFDFLENIATSLVMIRYPSPTAVLDMLAPVFTLVKWIFVSASFVLLLIGIVAAFVRWLRKLRER